MQTGEITNEQVKRADLLERFADRGKWLIGMEAYGSSQYWACKLQALGHTVRHMDAKLVKPFVQHNKSDRTDAEGIFNAVMQGVREVADKNGTERDLQAMLTMRAKIVEQRTVNINHVRGLLAEYGQVIPRSTTQFSKKGDECINALEGDAVQLVINTLRDTVRQIREDTERLVALKRKIMHLAHETKHTKYLLSVPGVGPVIMAYMMCTSVRSVRVFFREAVCGIPWSGADAYRQRRQDHQHLDTRTVRQTSSGIAGGGGRRLWHA